MIYEVTGDILLSKARAIAHWVAPGDPFEQGLAQALQERWPSLLKDFQHYSSSYHPSPGQAWVWAPSSGPRIIHLLTPEPPPGEKSPVVSLNMGMITQRAVPAEKSRAAAMLLESVNHALRELGRIIREQKLTSVAVSRLYSEVEGLEWSDVVPLIHAQLGMLDIPVIVYSHYHPNLQVLEPLSRRNLAQRLRPEAW
jgi:O-acetyl-ADP-ribose deacetylase (regulator of RNase III)